MKSMMRSMLFVIAWGLLPVVAWGQSIANAGNQLDPKKTFAVIVGVLAWEQGSLTTYPPEIRQDTALYEQLQRLGVAKEHMTLLLDKDATRAAITEAVIETAKRAGEESTLIIYYAGHGMKKGNEGIFACYDIRTQAMLQTGWRQNDLTELIKANFRGHNVLLFADCCFAGTLENVALDLSHNGFHAASLTSSSSINTSTNNWTFTLSLVDALRGHPIVDTNGDGVVTITEALAEVQQAMNHYERQRSGFAAHNLSADFQLTKVNDDLPDKEVINNEKLLGFKRGQFVSAKYGNKWRTGRVLHGRDPTATNADLLVQFQTDNQRPTVWLTAANIRPIEKPKLKQETPEPLPAEEAQQKASLDGKFANLLAKFEAPGDYRFYSEFRDYGEWTGSTYAGQRNLPPGHWVYVYPDWYIWQSDQINVQAPRLAVQQIQNQAVPAYDAKQMVGIPDTPQAGDCATAWATETEDDTNAWVELDYKGDHKPSAIHIYETYSPGSVYQVTGVIDKKETQLWKGVDPTPQNAGMGISKIPLETDLAFSSIRIYLNCQLVPGWNEIDAVALVDTEKKVHWAIDARASSTYNQNKNIPFVDPFQTEEGRRAERMGEINMQIRQHKESIREIKQYLDKEHAAIDKLYEELDELKDR